MDVYIGLRGSNVDRVHRARRKRGSLGDRSIASLDDNDYNGNEAQDPHDGKRGSAAHLDVSFFSSKRMVKTQVA